MFEVRSFHSLVVFFFLCCILIPSLATAIGVSPVSPEIDYGENESVLLEFTLSGLARDVELSAEGSMSDYISFPRDKIDYEGSRASFAVNITFPPYEEVDAFGKQKQYIVAKELPPDSSSLSATTAVKPSIIIHVPNPGLYAVFDEFTVDSVSEGENASYSLIIRNAGTDSFSGKSAEISITDMSGDIVDSFSLDDISVDSQDTFVHEGTFASDSFEPGRYTAEVSFDIDPSRNPFVTKSTFFIGTADVILFNHSNTLTSGSINEVDLELQSLWGSPLKGVRASVKDFAGKKQSLPVIDFSHFETKNVTAFIDVPETNRTQFNTTLTLKLPSDASSTPSKDIPLEFSVVEPSSDKQGGSGFSFTMTTALVSVISVLVVIIVIILFSLWKRRR